MLEISFLFQVSITIIIVYLVRFLQIKFFTRSKLCNQQTIMIVFGSGGHTSEILMIMKDFDFNQYQKIYFLKASSDTTTYQKFEVYYKQNSLQIDLSKIHWIDIPRSREVKQSYLTSILSTLYSIMYTYLLLTFRTKKIDLLITNGPGTCIPVVYSLYFNRILLINPNLKIVFIESFCRVYNLSLTGKLMYYIADRIIVHWKNLSDRYKRAKYYGKLL